jgi:hypothetical protein
MKVMDVQTFFLSRGARARARERLTFTGCMLKKPLDTQSGNFSRPPYGQTERSDSSSVCPLRMSLSTVFDGCFSPVLGKGQRSKGGIPRIRPALEQLCVEYVKTLDFYIFNYELTLVDLRRGYKHDPDTNNAGVLIVQLYDAGKDVGTKNSDCRIHS